MKAARESENGSENINENENGVTKENGDGESRNNGMAAVNIEKLAAWRGENNGGSGGGGVRRRRRWHRGLARAMAAT